MKIFALSSALMLAACAPTAPFITGSGIPEYEFVGCYAVQNEQVETGEVAFNFIGLKTDTVYFKQKNADGTIDSVKTGVPCE